MLQPYTCRKYVTSIYVHFNYTYIVLINNFSSVMYYSTTITTVEVTIHLKNIYVYANTSAAVLLNQKCKHLSRLYFQNLWTFQDSTHPTKQTEPLPKYVDNAWQRRNVTEHKLKPWSTSEWIRTISVCSLDHGESNVLSLTTSLSPKIY